jgi:hypothetical protein
VKFRRLSGLLAAIPALLLQIPSVEAKTEYGSCVNYAVCVRTGVQAYEPGTKFEWYEAESTASWSSNGWATPAWSGGQMRNRDWLGRYMFVYHVGGTGVALNCRRLPYDNRTWVGVNNSSTYTFYSVDSSSSAVSGCTGV